MKSEKLVVPENSFSVFFKRYFAHVCELSSMHGAQYLTKAGLFFWERVMWLCLMLSAASMIFFCTAIFIERHVERPMGTTIERDHINWETFFPVFTICAQDKVNETAFEAFVRERRPRNASEFRLFLRSLVNLSFDNLHRGLAPSADAASIEPQEYLRLIHRLSNRHQNFIVLEALHKETFQLDHVMTEFGPCATFNSRAMSAISWDFLLTGLHPPDQPVYKTFYAQGDVVGRMQGLNGTGALDIFFHSPLGTPSTIQAHRVRVSNKSATHTSLQLSTTDIVSHVKVKQLFQVQRKCLFFYEGTLRHSPHLYSHELCLQECRIEKMKRICGCLLHWYRTEDSWGESVCDRRGVACVAQHLKTITNSSEECSCYKSCDDTTFRVTSVQKVPGSHGRSLQIQVSPSKTRFRREVQFKLYELLVSFGNCTCFFMGISGISIMEFFFFYMLHMGRAYREFKEGK